MPNRKSESDYKSTQNRTFKRGGKVHKVMHTADDIQHNVAILNWVAHDRDDWVQRAKKVDTYLTELGNYTKLKHGIVLSRRKLFMKIFENFMDNNPVPKNIQ